MTPPLRKTLILLLSTLVGCAISTKSVPKYVADMEKDMASQNVALASSYSSFVSRVPGLTFTGSMSHLPGQRPLYRKPEASLRMPSNGNAPSLTFSEYPNIRIAAT